MIVYNVTINVHDDIAEEWVKWMKEIHIPQVMATGIFLEYSFNKLITRQEDEDGTTFCIQYRCESIALYEQYDTQFATALREETSKKYAGKFVAFRTLMEEL